MKPVATGAHDMENGHRRVLGPNFGASLCGHFSICRKVRMRACNMPQQQSESMNHECCQFMAFMI
jgi:hypothetical protein